VLATTRVPGTLKASGLQWGLGLSGQEAVAVDDRSGQVDQLAVVLLVVLVGVAMSVRILKQYERAVMFHLGKVRDGARGLGLIFFAPLINQVHRVSLRIVTMPIQSQGIITRDNVSIDVSAVAYYRVDDPIRSVVAIENVEEAINQIAQTTLRAVVGRHTLDETLSETDTINKNIREILDVHRPARRLGLGASKSERSY